MSLISGATGDWEMVIGLEVHAQVACQAKLFSGAATAFGGAPNSHVSFVDAAMPGMLPVINEAAVRQAVRTGLALEAEINLVSVFDRKNYFYPDLPFGYQISQYSRPVVGKGSLTVDLGDGESKTVGITRLHLEQDAGKSIHDRHPDKTYVDLNRAGVPLMEIVSEPDLRSPEEAGAYLRKLRAILRCIGACDGNMEQGSLRCDANVSVRRPGGPLGTRCEIKNLNSVRFLMRAITHEAERQVAILEDGGSIDQETRLYDPDRQETRSMRSKEEAHDYRYFPDPDLLPLELEQAWVDALAAALPELPDAKKRRFVAVLGLTDYDAGVLVDEPERAAYFERLAEGRDAKTAANWVTGPLLGAVNKAGIAFEDAPVPAARLGALLDLVADDVISGSAAKQVFEVMWETGGDPARIVDAKGLRQVSDSGALSAAVQQVIADNPDKVAEFKAGKDKLFGFFMGQVMKATGGKANPKQATAILRAALKG